MADTTAASAVKSLIVCFTIDHLHILTVPTSCCEELDCVFYYRPPAYFDFTYFFIKARTTVMLLGILGKSYISLFRILVRVFSSPFLENPHNYRAGKLFCF